MDELAAPSTLEVQLSSGVTDDSREAVADRVADASGQAVADKMADASREAVADTVANASREAAADRVTGASGKAPAGSEEEIAAEAASRAQRVAIRRFSLMGPAEPPEGSMSGSVEASKGNVEGGMPTLERSLTSAPSAR